MAYDFDDRCTDVERELRDAMDAIRAKALELDKLIGQAEKAAWPSPIGGYEWDELNPADLGSIRPAAYADKHAEAVAQQEHEMLNCMDRVRA